MTCNSTKMNHFPQKNHLEEFIQWQNNEVVERINSRADSMGFKPVSPHGFCNINKLLKFSVPQFPHLLLRKTLIHSSQLL